MILIIINTKQAHQSLTQLEKEESASEIECRQKVQEVQIMRIQYANIKAALFKEIENNER